MADKRKLDRSEWPSHPPGKYQFYPGCDDPVRKNGTIYSPPKIEYEWEKVAKRSKAEATARRSKARSNAIGTAKAQSNSVRNNLSTDREVRNVIEQMVSVIAEVSNARQISVGVWR